MNIVVNNLLTSYLESGPAGAPVVLMLHGWGTNSRTFDGLVRDLTPKYRVLCLDLPGFGSGQSPPAAWHIHDYATFVQAFLHKLEIRRQHAIIGHSFGGRIAIKAVGTRLLEPSRLILMDSAGVRHSASVPNQIFKVIAKTGKAATSLPGLSRLRGKLRRNLYRAAGSSDYLTAGALRQTFINTINEDIQPDAARITIPTLLIWGAADTDTPSTDGRTLANLIPHSTFSLVAGAGHFVHHDAPDRVAALIDEFLA